MKNIFKEKVTMFCKNCGTQNADDAKVCSHCGQPLDAATPVQQPQTVIIQQTAEPAKSPKNVGALVCGIIGSVFALIGAIIWTAAFGTAADCLSSIGFDSTKAAVYCAVFAILGIGGGVVSLVGSVQAFKFKQPAGIVMSIVGLLCQVGAFIAQCVVAGGHFGAIIILSIWTIIGLVLLVVETILAGKKAPKNN